MMPLKTVYLSSDMIVARRPQRGTCITYANIRCGTFQNNELANTVNHEEVTNAYTIHIEKLQVNTHEKEENSDVT
jgi:hypothetical protein